MQPIISPMPPTTKKTFWYPPMTPFLRSPALSSSDSIHYQMNSSRSASTSPTDISLAPAKPPLASTPPVADACRDYVDKLVEVAGRMQKNGKRVHVGI